MGRTVSIKIDYYLYFKYSDDEYSVIPEEKKNEYDPFPNVFGEIEQD